MLIVVMEMVLCIGDSTQKALNGNDEQALYVNRLFEATMLQKISGSEVLYINSVHTGGSQPALKLKGLLSS